MIMEAYGRLSGHSMHLPAWPPGGSPDALSRSGERCYLHKNKISSTWSGGVPINVNNPEADALTRKFARLAGVSITDAIVIAMKEAIERRRHSETPLQTAARLREKYGVVLGDKTRKPLPREAFDEMWDAD
jgi:antitoxin VapB